MYKVKVMAIQSKNKTEIFRNCENKTLRIIASASWLITNGKLHTRNLKILIVYEIVKGTNIKYDISEIDQTNPKMRVG